MKLAWKLALAYFTHHPARMALTSLAVAASAAIVVWVVSGYDALSGQFGHQATQYLGRYDFFIVPEDAENPFIAPSLVAALQNDPAAADVAPVVQTPIQRLINPEGRPEQSNSPLPQAGEGQGVRARSSAKRPDPNTLPKGEGTSANPRPRRPGPAPTLVGTDAAAPPHALVEGRWIDPTQPDRRDAVLDKNTADEAGLKLGDAFLIIIGPKEYRLKLVGTLESGPGAMVLGRRMRPPSEARTGVEAGPASAAVYVPMKLAERFSRGQAKINLVNIQLKPDWKPRAAEFRKNWQEKIAKARPVVSLLGVEDIQTGIEEGMMARRARQQAWAASGLSLLAALFIIFTTLSMGVTERVRQFAMMRAVGLSRGQIARLIATEGLVLALIGWAGGLAAGWGLLAVVAWFKPELFRSGATLGGWCVGLTGLSALGGAMVASILPAWRATSVQPLEALSPRQTANGASLWIALLSVAGVGLIAVNPFLVYLAAGSISEDRIYFLYMALGCTTMAVGFLLLAPAAILIVERLLGPPVAVALGLPPRLLRCQLAGNLGRTLGTTAALTVGLGLFAALQIWGYSMLEPFKPGDWNPDMLVSFQRGGLPDSEIAAVQSIKGVRPGRCIPLTVEQPRLASDLTGSQQRASVIRQDNIIIVGLDPYIAFGGDDPLVKLRFVEGNAKQAVARLKQGRNCIVPDHFLRATGLKLGERFSMVPPESPGRRVEYTIVGAVELPGWHWMTKFSGLRRREGRSAAMIFADYDAVRRDFDLNQINFFWMDIDPNVGVASIGESLIPIAQRNTGAAQPVNAQGAWSFGAQMFGDSVRITTPQEIHHRITARASDIIWASCYLPLVTLAVTSLGVVNTVMASVRARRWEFGVLRSQGVTRGGLVRMILAEGLLIGLITCLLSLGFGVLSGWCGTGISQHVSFFGGLAPPLVIPWAQLSLGFGMALGLCLLAALWPAVSTGRTEPLKLLQTGRSAL